MDSQSRNIYKNARIAAGLTQERWAEHLGVSADSVRKYESGERMPGDDVVLTMAEVSGQLILPYWHLTRKSRVAAAILPELDQELGLPEAVLSLLIQVDDFREQGLQKLLRIAADGKIDSSESQDFDTAMAQLLRLVSAAMALGFAK